MKKIVTLALVVLAFTTQLAFANVEGNNGAGCNCKGQMLQELNLTAAQQQQIQQLREQNKSQMQAQREQMQSLRTQIQEMVKSDNIDEAKLDSLVNQKTALMASMMKARIKMKNQIYNMLDPQQKAKFSSIMERKKQGALNMSMPNSINMKTNIKQTTGTMPKGDKAGSAPAAGLQEEGMMDDIMGDND